MASSASASPLERLRASTADRRAQNPQFKQKQLFLLHAELIAQADEICATLVEDSRNSTAEVETEFYLTVNSIRQFYESIDFDQDAKEEHLITKSVDNTPRRVPTGIAVVRPTTYTRLFSIIVPIAAAIAGGNCIILELEEDHFALDAGLREALSDALDNDTFAIINTTVAEQDLASCILVDQTNMPRPNAQLASSSEARAIGIVDQSADIDAAAKAIVTARFSFQGLSPYAPDLVIISDSIKQDFFKACTRHAAQGFTSNPPAPRSQDHPSRAAQKAIKDAEDKEQLATFGSANFTLVDIFDSSSPVANMKIRGRYLPIISYTNLTDAISSENRKSTLLAGYFFGAPETGRSLSQQLDCHFSCINQLPVHLLVGPAAPLTHPPAFQTRYSPEMFTVARPQYIQLQPTSLILGLALASGASKSLDSYTGVNVTASGIRKLSMAPLPPPPSSSSSSKWRGGGSVSMLGGLLEQGLISNVASVLVGLAVVGYGVWIYMFTSAQVAEFEG